MSATSPSTVSPQELARIRRAGRPVCLIDVRTPVEFQSVHADIAENVPLDRLAPDALPGDPSGPTYVICKSGSRGRSACAKLRAAGVEEVVNVEGGTDAWVAAGLPVVRGASVMSLERQVRIVAGTLVLIGVVLGALVHPYCVGLSAFVGAGLVYAGVTDNCGMGMLLTRMPWNTNQQSTCKI